MTVRDEHRDGDLFWALRGAGVGNFGVLFALRAGEIYDPAANTWTTFDPPLDPGRGGVTSAVVPGNRVLAIGGAFSTARGFVMPEEVDRSPSVQHVQH